MLAGVEAILRGATVADGYLIPTKRLMLDVLTSKEGASHCLESARALIGGLEKNGHAVMFAPSHQVPRIEFDEREVADGRVRYPSRWSPSRATVAQFRPNLIGLALVETSVKEEVAYVKGNYLPVSVVKKMRQGHRTLLNWDVKARQLPSKRLRLVAYAPYNDVAWQKS